jgi:hypothetical protein
MGMVDVSEIPSQSFRMPASDASRYLEQASALSKLGNYQEAIPLYESALATLERIYGPDQPEIAECLQELGEAYEAGYRLGDALNIHVRLLRMGEKILGRANPNVVAMLLKLSQINEMLGRPNDALSYCHEALESAKQCLPQDDPLSQHIIERFNYLATMPENLPPEPQQSAGHDHDSNPTAPANWQEEMPLRDFDLEPPPPKSMQDFAREMLSEMPGSPAPFGQSGNAQDNSTSAHGQMPGAEPGLANQHYSTNDHGSQPGSGGLAPNTVPPSPFNNQSSDYQASLEAGFSAAQNLSSQRNPSLPYSGGTGNGQQAQVNNPSPQTSYGHGQAAPATGYDSGDTGTYNRQQLDGIRYGRRESVEMDAPPANRAKVRRVSSEADKSIMIRKLAKTFAFPLLGLLSVIVVLVLLALHPKENQPVQEQHIPAVAAGSFGRFCTTDGEKEVRLVSASDAVLVSGHSAFKMPYAQISSAWGDLFSAMVSSISEKQIWGERKDYGIRTQDEIIYYAADGAEAKVVAKMKRLAGIAQAYFEKKGEYPKYVGNMSAEFTFTNPLDGHPLPIPIKILASQTVDGSDVKTGLDSGLEVGLVASSGPEASMVGNAPCSITCYAVVIAKGEDNPERLRATKFFVRGCDRNGTYLAAGSAGRNFVVPASDAYLAALPPAALGDLATKGGTGHAKAPAKSRAKGKTKTAAKAQSEASADDEDTASEKASSGPPALAIDNPPKNTKLWLIADPAFPMVLMHHSLPLLLVLLAGLVFVQSRVMHVDATGSSISSTSNTSSEYTKIAAAILLGVAFLTIFIQLVVFG